MTKRAIGDEFPAGGAEVRGRQGFASTARLAQSAERKALNLVVVGSSPTVGALATRALRGMAEAIQSAFAIFILILGCSSVRGARPSLTPAAADRRKGMLALSLRTLFLNVCDVRSRQSLRRPRRF